MSIIQNGSHSLSWGMRACRGCYLHVHYFHLDCYTFPVGTINKCETVICSSYQELNRPIFFNALIIGCLFVYVDGVSMGKI